jgi:hypothetical protein
VDGPAGLVNQHLSRLRMAGVVMSRRRKDGVVVYALRHDRMRSLVHDAVALTADDTASTDH